MASYGKVWFKIAIAKGFIADLMCIAAKKKSLYASAIHRVERCITRNAIWVNCISVQVARIRIPHATSGNATHDGQMAVEIEAAFKVEDCIIAVSNFRPKCSPTKKLVLQSVSLF